MQNYTPVQRPPRPSLSADTTRDWSLGITDSLKLEKSSRSSPAFDQIPLGPLNHTTKCHIHLFSEHSHRWWFHHFLVESVPMLYHFSIVEILSNIQPEPWNNLRPFPLVLSLAVRSEKKPTPILLHSFVKSLGTWPLTKTPQNQCKLNPEIKKTNWRGQ